MSERIWQEQNRAWVLGYAIRGFVRADGKLASVEKCFNQWDWTTAKDSGMSDTLPNAIEAAEDALREAGELQ